MKQTIGYCILFLFFSCQSQTYTNLNHMTPEKWQEDIEYINKKIQKEFESFDGTIKSKFNDKAKDLINDIQSLDNAAAAIKIGQLLGCTLLCFL